MTSRDFHCDALMSDLDGDGVPDIIMIGHANEPFADHEAHIFRQAESGVWRLEGAFFFPAECAAVHDAFRSGHLAAVPPLRRWNDIEIAGARFHIKDTIGFGLDGACPKP